MMNIITNILKSFLLLVNAFIWTIFSVIALFKGSLWSSLLFFLAAFLPLRSTRKWIKNKFEISISRKYLSTILLILVLFGFVTKENEIENTSQTTNSNVSSSPNITTSLIPTPVASSSPLSTSNPTPTQSVNLSPTSTLTQETELETQLTQIKVDEPSAGTTKLAKFVVPDTSPTESAFGGDLRKYDIHIAKMFEVTHWWCMQSPDSEDNGLSWKYLAGGGEIDMGTFNISCDEATKVALRFRFSKPEDTPINVGEAALVTESIPMLDISNEGAISAWINFTTSYTPNQNFTFDSDPTFSPTITTTPSVTTTSVPVDPNAPTRSAGSGKCDCPYDYNEQGQLCGNSSAYSRPGGASPICYERDRL